SGFSSDSAEDPAWREIARCQWNSLLPFTLWQRQENLSGASEPQLPKGEIHKESHMQQILRNCGGHMKSISKGDTHFQALPAEVAFPETERPFLNFHHQPFQPLEPSLDFDTSSSSSQYKVSDDNREFNKTLKVSRKSQGEPAFLEMGNSSLNRQRNNLFPGLETAGSRSLTSEGCIKDNIA
ncbi:CE295 protein, partial [Centropus bengalensis]|nr:CE295 protein [Centropus bengalensis]